MFPHIYISHGAPTVCIDHQHPVNHWWSKLGKEIGKPQAILAISAHWENEPVTVSTTSGKIIHDFYGFPDEMYKLKYPSPSHAGLVDKVIAALSKANIKVVKDSERGLDHGTWVPLLKMYPDADVPVVQLSLNANMDFKTHVQLGNALKSVKNEMDVLIITSGSVVHNLKELKTSKGLANSNPIPPPKWAFDFEQQVFEAVSKNNQKEREDAIIKFKSHKDLRQAHPTFEHFVPVHVAVGIGGKASRMFEFWDFGSLTYHAYRFSDE